MIEFDETEVIDLFKTLSGKEQDRAYKAALSKVGKILVDETKSELKNVRIKKTNQPIQGIDHVHSEWGNISLIKGIKHSVPRSNDQATVHIMGDFRLKFFEKGTDKRETRKGYNRGSIDDYRFFRKAQQNKKEDILRNLERILSESILRVAQRSIKK